MLQNIAADFGRAATGIAIEQGRAVLNDGHAAFRIQLREAVEQEELLAVGNLGQPGGKAPRLAAGVLGLHHLFLALPVNAERRVGDDVAELVAAELVLGKRVTVAHVVRVAATDEHIGLGDGVGLCIELLAATGHGRGGVEGADALLHAREHLRCAHGHIIHRHVGIAGLGATEQQVGHQVDDIAAGEVRPCFLGIGFGELAHQFLKDVAAIHRADFVRPQIALGRGELLHHEEERVMLHQRVKLVFESELGEDILHVSGETRQIIAEIGLDVVGVGNQRFKRKLAGVVELVTCGAHEQHIQRAGG